MRQQTVFWECSPADGAVTAFTPRGLRHIHARQLQPATLHVSEPSRKRDRWLSVQEHRGRRKNEDQPKRSAFSDYVRGAREIEGHSSALPSLVGATVSSGGGDPPCTSGVKFLLRGDWGVR